MVKAPNLQWIATPPSTSTHLPIPQHAPVMAKKEHFRSVLSANHNNLNSEISRSSKI